MSIINCFCSAKPDPSLRMMGTDSTQLVLYYSETKLYRRGQTFTLLLVVQWLIVFASLDHGLTGIHALSSPINIFYKSTGTH